MCIKIYYLANGQLYIYIICDFVVSYIRKMLENKDLGDIIKEKFFKGKWVYGVFTILLLSFLSMAMKK